MGTWDIGILDDDLALDVQAEFEDALSDTELLASRMQALKELKQLILKHKTG